MVFVAVLKSSYPESSDGGFCANLAVIVFYYMFYAPVVYLVIVKDSPFVFANRLDDSLLFKDDRLLVQRAEETTLLLREYPISGMVDLLADQSLAVIAWNELHVTDKLGAGGFGEGVFTFVC